MSAMLPVGLPLLLLLPPLAVALVEPPTTTPFVLLLLLLLLLPLLVLLLLFKSSGRGELLLSILETLGLVPEARDEEKASRADDGMDIKDDDRSLPFRGRPTSFRYRLVMACATCFNLVLRVSLSRYASRDCAVL